MTSSRIALAALTIVDTAEAAGQPPNHQARARCVPRCDPGYKGAVPGHEVERAVARIRVQDLGVSSGVVAPVDEPQAAARVMAELEAGVQHADPYVGSTAPRCSQEVGRWRWLWWPRGRPVEVVLEVQQVGGSHTRGCPLGRHPQPSGGCDRVCQSAQADQLEVSQLLGPGPGPGQRPVDGRHVLFWHQEFTGTVAEVTFGSVVQCSPVR